MYQKIQYISQGRTEEEQLTNISSVLEAGCSWIQLRFKEASPEMYLQTAQKVQQLCENYEATFIVNDHVEIAAQLDADGVHLGLTDTSIAEARKLLGSHKIIGGTANTLEQVIQRIKEKCNYIGLGPYRFTTTKEKLSPMIGLEGYQQLQHYLDLRNIQVPIYAIGGIKIEDIEELMQTDIAGIAVSGLLTNTKNTKEIFTLLNQKIDANITYSGAGI